jgi:hypothetical protein
VESTTGLPREVAKKFNWGAMYFSFIWGLNHKKYITLLIIPLWFIPYFGGLAALAFGIWIGISGNQWAWDSGRFSSPAELQDCQTIWRKWAVGVLAAHVALMVILVFVIARIAPNRPLAGPQYPSSSYSRPYNP